VTAPAFFITGTDTGVGKTRVAASLIAAFQQQGQRVLAMKPVACGLIEHDGRMINEDVRTFAALTGQNNSDPSLCPFALPEPVSPNIAAERVAISIDITTIAQYLATLRASADLVIVEGAGGWLVPLLATETMADLACALRLPVIVVVGLRLGCLNHALLTVNAVRSSGLPLAGWLANQIDPDMREPDANIATLTQFIGTPPLAILPHDRSGQGSSECLRAAAEVLLAQG
jgi:dethiobiotin synthetase